MSPSTHIRFELLEERLPALKNAFATAAPFPHIVVDNILHDASLAAVVEAMPAPEESKRSNDYLFAKNKFENPGFANSAQIFEELRDELLSDRFAEILSAVYDKPLFVDPRFLGGGIHQGGEGSFLDMHADFNRHPANKNWLRELNILLYLNQGHQEEWGGHLEMQHRETGERGRIAPVANRLVIMMTKPHTLHGYKPISFPKGRYRTSLAAYAYSLNEDFANVPLRSTQWEPENANVMKTSIARLWSPLVKIKTSLVGSNTERRSRGD